MAPPPPPPPSAVEVVNVDSSDKTTTTLRPKNAQHEDEHGQQHHPDVVNVDGSSADDKKKPEEQHHTDNGAAPAVQPPPTHQAPDEHISSESTASPFSQETSSEKPTYQQLNEQQGKNVPRPLVFEDKLIERAYLKQRLAAAFRIFGRHGFDEGVAGHITVRDPVEPGTFWVNPFGVAFSQITSSSLLHISSTGSILPSPSPYKLLNTAAFAIHGAIHHARPDVVAAAHSHSIHGRALCALQVPLDMLTQDSCAFYEDHVVYPNFGGVVMATEEGKRIAATLGQKKCALLGNHGLLTVGGTVEEAVWWFVAMEKCARVQLLADAAAAGRGIQTVKIGDEEARLTWTSIGSRVAGYFSAKPLFDVVEKQEAHEYMDEGKPWVGKAEGV
ncbi:class II aldolase/adducin N-terminal [Phyllosticta capitalensis]|uniref:Class II aldolase/adducin N-terminal n=1 Tax=Phyllosticta capitalensis TaxID=121624 RepID=A0ABR1YA77_9PEZI